EDGIRDRNVTGVQTCALPISLFLMEIVSNVKKGRELIKTCYLPPMIIPPIVSGLIWRMMFQPSTGVLNYFLSFIGLAPEWLTSQIGRASCRERVYIRADDWCS